MMSVRLFGLLAGLVLLIGCSACTVVRPPAELFDDLHEASDVDPSFWPGIQHLVPQGETSEDLWQHADNCLLLGVKVSHHGRDSVWFVRMSSAQSESFPNGVRFAPFAVPMNIGALNTKLRLIAPAEKVWVETYDQHGTLIQASIRSVPTGFAPVSVFELCKYFGDHSSTSATAVEGSAVGMESLAALLIRLHVLGSSRSLRQIHVSLKENVVRIPGVLEFVAAGFNRQVQMMVHQTQWQARSPLGLIGSVPSTEMRFQVRCAGQALFNGRLLCRTPEPPFDLTGGLAMLEVVHPDTPGNRMTLCVLAARHRAPGEKSR